MPAAPTRRNRAEQAEVVRADVLAAARQEFLRNGFHGTSLDRIAATAGYTKGAVYSRFESKADLFLALLEERVEGRMEQNRDLAGSSHGTDALATLVQRWAEIQRADLPWTLLVIEFRVHAARQPAILERYAALHRRTIAGLADLLRQVLGDAAAHADLHAVATRLFAFGNAASLEQAVEPSAFSDAEVAATARAMLAEAGVS